MGNANYHSFANEQDIRHLQQLFSTFDVDGSGSIDVDES